MVMPCNEYKSSIPPRRNLLIAREESDEKRLAMPGTVNFQLGRARVSFSAGEPPPHSRVPGTRIWYLENRTQS